MIKYYSIAALTVLNFTAFAAATTAVQTINKDEWLGKLRDGVPAVICKNFTSNEAVNTQLKAVSIDYDKCVTLIPAGFDKCKGQFYSSMPENLDRSAAELWGKKIGECIGVDFAETHLKAVLPENQASTSTTPATTAPVETTPVNESQSMSKDEWLAKLKAAVPSLICKGFLDDKELNARLTKVNIDYTKCMTLLPASVDKCQSEFYSQLPATIEEASAGKWGHSIGECIGKDFAVKYLVGH